MDLEKNNKMIIEIKKESGIFYVNGKRRGSEKFSELETIAFNEYFKELKTHDKKSITKIIMEKQ